MSTDNHHQLMKVQGAEVGKTFLRIPPGTDKAEWNQIASKISNVGHYYWWWVGDLVNYAMHNFEKKEIERCIKELADATGVTETYIRMVGNTARLYPVRHRVIGLSISHHIQIRNLPQAKRDRLLHLALKKAWSGRMLEERILPRERRLVKVIFRIAEQTAKKKKFQQELAAFLATWKAQKFHIVGRARAARKKTQQATSTRATIS